MFRNKTDTGVVCTIEKGRKRLLKDRRSIVVTDYGSGGEKNKNRLRKVSDIARSSAIPRKYGKLLSNMCSAFGGSHIIELGTSLGISTLYLASGSGKATVHTLEGCPETSRIAAENFNNWTLSDIKMYCGPFDQTLGVIEREKFVPGLVFIDGDHRKESVIRYFYKVAEMSDDKTVIVLDDIHDTPGMNEAWIEIKNHNKVSVTVDIFRFGIVFFRKGIPRSDYIIRY